MSDKLNGFDMSKIDVSSLMKNTDYSKMITKNTPMQYRKLFYMVNYSLKSNRNLRNFLKRIKKRVFGHFELLNSTQLTFTHLSI